MISFESTLSQLALTWSLRFRLVSLQMTELRECYSQDQLEDQLESLPKDLDDFYHRIISEINEKHHEDALKILQWLSFAFRPLRLNEIVQVVGVVPDSECGLRFKKSRVYQDPKLVLRVCSSLVTYAEGNGNSVSLYCMY